MQLKDLLTEDRAVSPVIGVILMVAITVILAAVIGTFVLGLGDQVSESAPQASFSFDFNVSGNNSVTITHEGGETLEASNIGVEGDRTSLSFELAVDLSFSLTVAEALLLSARERDESRGAHYRTDAPDVDPDWRRNILVDRGDTGFELTTRGVADPSEAVSEAVEVGYELDYHHLE